MNTDTAEPAAVDTASGLAVPRARRAFLHITSGRAVAWLGRLSADPVRMRAARDSLRALWVSRVLVLAGGVGAVAVLGFGSSRGAFNPPGLTRGFGWLGDLLAAPVARWDSDWYLAIAGHGYHPDVSRTAYFPLYPLLMRAVGSLGPPLIVAGVLVSLCAFALALYGIHRLTTLELARVRGRISVVHSDAAGVARLAVIVTAFSPMAFFFSAVYTDALYLALSVGVFWSARHGRWLWVGVLGALAGATRSTGLMLAVPALIIYLYGPREDRPPDLGVRGLCPRYRPRWDLLWLALLPVGVGAYCGWLALSGGDALGPFHAEQAWSRHFVGPYLGVWDGVKAAFEGARQLLSFQNHHVYFKLAGGNPSVVAYHNLMELAFLLLAIPAVVGVLRRLPLAYGAYVLAAMALPLSYPVAPQPLMSVPRYLVVLFPLGIWLAAWLWERPRLQRPAFALSVLLMLFFTAEFSTWHWVA
jgi:hypothetical protein